jgi:hypothetical protein
MKIQEPNARPNIEKVSIIRPHVVCFNGFESNIKAEKIIIIPKRLPNSGKRNQVRKPSIPPIKENMYAAVGLFCAACTIMNDLQSPTICYKSIKAFVE